ncbi:MAG: MFS transporter [Fimbriimonadaceae bacterium]|nr:MFS transporter [Fimbriimonadaceae bacterium]
MVEHPNPPSRLEILQTLRSANLDVAFSTAFATLVTGAFLVGFVKLLGGGDLWIGFLSALPAALGVVQIPGAIIGRRFPSYKRFVLPGGALWRLLYIPVAILPLLAIADELRLFILIGCVSIAAFSVSLVNSTYNDWLAELVPPSSRGWYFSRRHAIGTGVGAGAGLLGGFLLDQFRARHQDAYGYAVVFGLGLVCASLSLVFFMRMRDMERAQVERQSLRHGLGTFVAPFRDRDFRKVLIFLAVFFLGQTFAGNLYAAYALETLKMPFMWIQACAVTQALGTIATSGLWGFLADKYGNKPCLILAGVGIALNPIAWIFTTPGNLTANVVILVGSHFLMGLFWCGVAITQFNLLLATAKVEDRASYLGAGMAIQSMVSGLAPLIGAEMMSRLRDAYPVESAYKGVFWAVMALRAVSILFLAPVKEEGSSRVQRTIQDLRRMTPRGMRAMRSLSKSGDVSTRVAAIQSVGNEGLTLASDEIVKALGDPSPSVRRNAARTLARLGDTRLAEPLLSHIEQHPDLVEEETVEALGELGNQRAVPTLIALLQSPRSLVRRAAAKALGRLGHPDAIEALIGAAQEVGDPDLRRSSIQALRVLEARESGAAIFDALFDPHPSVRIAAAEAVSELHLTDALPYVRQALAYYEDEAASELVYALGSVGTDEDFPLLLAEAQKQRTKTTRRRCLLGIAKLLGVETQIYRLMLVEGFQRDEALLTMLQPAIKANGRVRSALDQFGSGEEPKALRTLLKVMPTELMRQLAEAEIEESFLVAAVLMAHPR